MSKTAPGPGHNSGRVTVSDDRLRSAVERIERLEEEKKALASDIKDIYLEVKSAGYDVKVVRLLVRNRKRPAVEVEEEQNLLDLYVSAIGI